MSFKPVPFESLGTVSYIALALSCIISRYSEILAKNRDFFHILLQSRLPLGGPLRNIAIFATEKLE